MKRPGFLEGVVVALAASIAAGVLYTVLAPVAGSGVMLRAVIAGVGFAYLLYLLGRSEERVGRITCVLLWCAAAGVIAWAAPSLSLYMAGHLAAVWLVRVLYFHAGMTAALADLGLSAFSLAACVWALGRTGSVFGAAWCLFLVQALFVFIPSRTEAAASCDATGTAGDDFDRAYRTAQAAVRKLSAVP